MSKKGLFIDIFFVIFLTAAILFSTYLTSFLLSRNSARDTLKYYSNSISLIYKEDQNIEKIKQDYGDIKDIRITLFDKDANILLDINPEDKEASHENRLIELRTNTNNFYYKNSLTMGYQIYYFVNTIDINNDEYFLRIGLPKDDVTGISLYVLTYGAIVLAIIDIVYASVKIKIYKKSIQSLRNEVVKIENIAGVSAVKTSDDEKFLVMNTLNESVNIIEKQIIELKKEKGKIDYILDSMSEGFILLDENKKINLINRYALKVLKQTREYIENKDISYLFLGNELNNGVLEAFSKGYSSFDVTIDSKIYYFMVNKINLNFLDEENKTGLSIFFFDVSEARLNEKIRKEFFQNASHELKSPLTTIIGYEEMIEAGLIDDKKEIKDARTQVIKEAKRMRSVIDEMLALSRLEGANKENLKVQEIDAKSAIKEMINSFKVQLEEKNIKLDASLNPCILHMNLEDFDRLFRNLISNAIKYNKEKGKIKIFLDQNKFEISDTGIGIEKENQERIFERFFRVDKGRSRENGGTGLGLAIVKHICLNYNFKIKVDSEIMEGSTFTVYFR